MTLDQCSVSILQVVVALTGPPPRFTLADLTSGQYEARPFNGSWLSGGWRGATQLVTLDTWWGLQVVHRKWVDFA